MEDGFPKIPGGAYVQNIIGMTHRRRDDGRALPRLRPLLRRRRRLRRHPGDPRRPDDRAGLLALLFVPEAAGDLGEPRQRRLGRHFLALAVPRRDARRRLRGLVGHVLPGAGLQGPSAAIVGMAAMVGAGTGGVMTAIVMVFEMTRDYEIIVPVIVAVAVAAGVRRAADPRDDLHDQAAPSRPPHPEGAARQPLSRRAGART